MEHAVFRVRDVVGQQMKSGLTKARKYRRENGKNG